LARREVRAPTDPGAEHALRKLAVNPVPCTGCLSCEAVCALHRAGDQDRRASAIRVELDIFGGANGPSCCRQCDEAPCVIACPAGAIVRNTKTGAWETDAGACLRCGVCIEACPYDALFWWSESRGPARCDLCGGLPACVEACRFGAIRYLDEDDPLFGETGMPEAEQSTDAGRGAKC